MTNAPCLEVAVYDVSDGDTFGELHRLAHRELSAYPGYLAGVALRGLEEASLRADLSARLHDLLEDPDLRAAFRL